jgi:glyoxylase-like metal-dependent hydrolase (beta-lactamase superfamily II)
MRNTIITLLFLFILTGLSGQTVKSSLEFSHLTGDFYIYTTYKDLNGNRYPSNSMYLVTTKGVVLFDTPWDSTQFQPLLDSIMIRHNKRVVLCLSTHYHNDRTAGLEFFSTKTIRTYSSKQTWDLCKKFNEKQSQYYFLNDTTFTVGNHRFETFYPGEGHTRDNIVIWFDNDKILYGGCFVKSTESEELGNIVDANTSEWGKSVENVLKKYPAPKYVIPGHMGWQNNTGLQHTLRLLRTKGKN